MQNHIIVVCFANYCRSPVAEFLLREQLPENFLIESAGLNPMIGKGMDQRSLHYLHKKGIKTSLHNPKRITRDMIKRSSEVFALDLSILSQLNEKFPNLSYKFKLLNFQQPKSLLMDPFRMENDDYFVIMKKIEDVCNKLVSSYFKN